MTAESTTALIDKALWLVVPTALVMYPAMLQRSRMKQREKEQGK